MRAMKNNCRFVLFLLLALCCQAKYVNAQSSASGEGAQQFAELGDFKLQSGAVIQDFRLGYRTLGTLNGGKSNGVLWPSWLGGKSTC
jgi:homoserine acetyltransferase